MRFFLLRKVFLIIPTCLRNLPYLFLKEIEAKDYWQDVLSRNRPRNVWKPTNHRREPGMMI